MLFFSQKARKIFFTALLVFTCFASRAQFEKEFVWSKEGNSYFKLSANEIVRVSLPDNKETVVLSNEEIIPANHARSLPIRNFYFSNDNYKILILYQYK